MIEAKRTFLQVQQNGMFGHARKLMEAILGKAPERFNAANVGRALPKFVVAMLAAVVAVIAHIHQPVVAACHRC